MPLHEKHHHAFVRFFIAAVMIMGGAYISGQVALDRVATPQLIQQQIDLLLKDTTRQLYFDHTAVKRQLFPRPTLILKQVKLTESDGKTEALAIDEIKIGFDWSSLFGMPSIEKLVINQPVVKFIRDAQGRWNIADLWKKNARGKVSFNRIQINNGRLIVQDEYWGQIQLDQIQLSSAYNSGALPYRISAQAHTPYSDSLLLQADGVAQWGAGLLSLPNAQIIFNGKESGYDFNGSVKTNAVWQNEHFLANEMHIALQTYRNNGSLNIHINQLQSKHGDMRIQGATGVFSSNQSDNLNAINATLTIPNITWHNQKFSGNNVILNLTTRPSNWDATINTNVEYTTQAGLQLSQTKVQTQQNVAENRVRFLSEWEGNLRMRTEQDWQLEGQGLFDRQPSSILLRREMDNVSGKIKIAKLNLTPYLNSKTLQFVYPDLPKSLNIQAQLELDTLDLPSVQIDNIQTTLNINAEKMQLSPWRADLYSGHTEGEMTWFNQTPARYHIKQTAQNVQVRPLLQDMFGESGVSGKGTAEWDLTVVGNQRQEWWHSLTGNFKLDINDGQWWGINFARLGETFIGNPNGVQIERQDYPFSHFVLDAQLENGISHHKIEAELTEPAARMNSQGQMDFGQDKLNEDIIFKLKNSDMPLPLRVNGSIYKPTVSLNYPQLTSGLDGPEAKQKAISDVFKKQWKGLLQKKTK